MADKVVAMSMSQWAKYLFRLKDNAYKAARRGARSGALRAIPTLHTATSEAPPANPMGVGEGGAVNTGRFKRSWKWSLIPHGAMVFNNAPYAPPVEYGRNPSGQFPPIKAIAQWAQRRLKLDRKEAERAAFAIARNIAEYGQMPRNILADSMPKIEEDFVKEVVKELDRELEKP